MRSEAIGFVTLSVFGMDFNPRTHVECDLRAEEVPIQAVNFNPRTHVECD